MRITRQLAFSLTFFLPLLINPGCGECQTSASEQEFKLTVDVNLVNVLATVTTSEGALVADLTSDDFQIFDNNILQEIVFFGKEADQSLRLCLLFDASISVASELKTQQEAAINFLTALIRTRDRVSIFRVTEDVEELVRYSNRLDLLRRTIQAIKPAGGTSLYDSVYLAAESLATSRGRKVIVIISDGTDTTSEVSFHACLRMTRASECVVYAMVVQPIKSEPGRNLAGEHSMSYLAEKTGGRFFKVNSPSDLRNSFSTISDELRTHYLLGYYPKERGESAEFRRIEVRVDRPGSIVRARDGYHLPTK